MYKGNNQPDLFASVERAELDEEAKVQAREAKIEAQRERLLAKIREGRLQLDTIESRVAYILSQRPDTRNSDITLQLQYWHVFQRQLMSGGMVEIEALYKLERLTDLTRARQKIQNTLRLFVATDERVAEQRKQRGEAFRQHHAPADVSVPHVFVYGDESGKNDEHLIVGSVWMLATGDYFNFLEETNRWKEERRITYELHSAALGRSRLEAYREFIARFIVKEGTFGFKAVSIPSVGISDKQVAFADLYYFLLRRGIEHESATGRAPLPRTLTFVKDFEEEGSDERILALLGERLARDHQAVFRGQLYFDIEDSVSSKTDILIQIADLFTWSVNRRLNEIPKRNGAPTWKDDFANWFLDAVQFEMEEASDYNDRAVHLALRSPTLKPRSAPVIHVPEEELIRYDSQGSVSKRKGKKGAGPLEDGTSQP